MRGRGREVAGPDALRPLKVGGAAKHDWQAVRHDFIFLGASREDVVRKYGLPARLFDHHARKGDWAADKADMEGRLRDLMEGVPSISDSVLEAVDKQWRERFRELEQMAVYIKRWIAAHKGYVEPVQLRQLMAAQRDIIQMQRLLMGESTEILQSVDRAVEAVLVVVEQFVPDSNKERFKDAVSRLVLIEQPAGRPEVASAAIPG
jgi:hypothetical protein